MFSLICICTTLHFFSFYLYLSSTKVSQKHYVVFKSVVKRKKVKRHLGCYYLNCKDIPTRSRKTSRKELNFWCVMNMGEIILFPHGGYDAMPPAYKQLCKCLI